MLKIIAIAVGGAFGALMRYFVASAVSGLVRSSFPFGTIVVNITGCLLIGFFWGIAEKGAMSPHVKLVVFTGFLGAFTTFSTYSLETINLLRSNEIQLAVFNIIISTVLGVIFAYLGYLFSNLFLRT